MKKVGDSWRTAVEPASKIPYDPPTLKVVHALAGNTRYCVLAAGWSVGLAARQADGEGLPVAGA